MHVVECVSDEVPENYWEMLAEQRRSALEESLTENKQVTTRVIVSLVVSE